MKWRSPRVLIPLILVLLLLVGGGLAFVFLRSPSSPQTSIAWKAPSNNFTQQDQQGIQAALKSALLASRGESVTGHIFTIIDAERQGDWADLSANEQTSANTQPIATEPIFFLAHVQSTTWSVWLPISPGFCDQLKQTPDTLLDSVDKHYFLGCYQ
jgi:hypothetical protein